MEVVDIRFEPADIEGVVPVGSYLAAVAKRVGIKEFECDLIEGEHICEVEITIGIDTLSDISAAEGELLSTLSERETLRYACFTRLEKAGKVVVMTRRKEKDKEDEAKGSAENIIDAEEYKKQFAEMPLEKKFANLVQLEAMAFNDTVSFVLNSPYKVADKVMDVLAEFGFAKHEAEREASKPDKQAAAGTEKKEKSQKTSPKPHSKKTSEDEASA